MYFWQHSKFHLHIGSQKDFKLHFYIKVNWFFQNSFYIAIKMPIKLLIREFGAFSNLK